MHNHTAAGSIKVGVICVHACCAHRHLHRSSDMGFFSLVQSDSRNSITLFICDQPIGTATWGFSTRTYIPHPLTEITKGQMHTTSDSLKFETFGNLGIHPDGLLPLKKGANLGILV